VSPDPHTPRRLALQAALDRARTDRERNIAGQFATPWPLARAVVRAGLDALPPGAPVRFLDPAFGLGAFYDALRAETGDRPIERATAFEADPHFAGPAAELWADTPLRLQAADFTRAAPPTAPTPLANLVVCNPPYSRHHHLSPADKARLQAAGEAATGRRLSGLAGLHAHFLLVSRAWMAPGGAGVWLLPAEFLDVGYGAALRSFLTDDVELLHLHRFDPADLQFADALVTSAVVVFRAPGAEAPPPTPIISVGGALDAPRHAAAVPRAALRSRAKWSGLPAPAPAPSTGPVIGDRFTVRRGVATGGNAFFVRPRSVWAQLGVDEAYLQPVLPPPRRLPGLDIPADPSGLPALPDPPMLLRTHAPLAQLDREAPALAALLRAAEPTVGQGYLCSRRDPWYRQEARPAAPLVCTYMGRAKGEARPFRVLRNRSRAIATNNVLLLSPRPEAWPGGGPTDAQLDAVWRWLNTVPVDTLTAAGRVYGGGLHKLEPRELMAVPLPPIGPAHEPAAGASEPTPDPRTVAR